MENKLRVISKETLRKETPKWAFKKGTRLLDHMQLVEETAAGTVIEFLGTDNFAAAWYQRQQFEVDAGRNEEPILYLPIYDVIEDGNLPRSIPVDRIGPAQVIFDYIEEGQEVKFVNVGSSSFSVLVKQVGAGLEYNKAIVMFNELWNIPIIERQFGIAHNALLNHAHLYPILSYTYGADNQTNGGSITYDPESDLPTAYLRTLEEAVTHASADTDNSRRGPYALVVATANRFTAERALTVVGQLGSTKQSSVAGDISTVIVYNGWSGRRGKKTVTYPGVTAGKAYLVDLATRTRNFRSFVKQGLQSVNGNPDVSRFVLEQTIWDSWFGVLASPSEGVEEITWPIAADLTA